MCVLYAVVAAKFKPILQRSPVIEGMHNARRSIIISLTNLLLDILYHFLLDHFFFSFAKKTLLNISSLTFPSYPDRPYSSKPSGIHRFC